MDRELFETRLSKARHDLRTPLKYTFGYCEILIEDAEDQRSDDLIPDLKKVRGADQQLLDLAGTLLSGNHLLGEAPPPTEQEIETQAAARTDIDLSTTTLPTELLECLYTAVDVHRVSEVRDCIEEIKALGGETTELATRLDELCRAYDMEPIRFLVKEMRDE
ncbi:MAG: hypothetical protein ACKVJG_26765 [Candidatus Latescibacterota bacterium]|jgi:hypothetical protein|tara:strand:- start:351 stop:839 length:489 start_codon:yes stop_codon:yes gene_type:complete